MIPLPYNPREKNIIQTILEENYTDFENIYDEVYAKDYGIYRLERIGEAVNKFTSCGDWSHGIARIRCSNPDCKYEYLLGEVCLFGLGEYVFSYFFCQKYFHLFFFL